MSNTVEFPSARLLRQHGWQAAKIILALAILGAMWLVFYYWFLGFTEGHLAPWDLVPQDAVDERPPVGSVSQIVNDFFESGPGMWLPSTILLAGSVLAFAWRLWQRAPLVDTALSFAASLLIFFNAHLLLLLSTVPLYDGLLREHVHEGISFYHSIPGLVVTALLLVGLFRVQWLGRPYRALLYLDRRKGNDSGVAAEKLPADF